MSRTSIDASLFTQNSFGPANLLDNGGFDIWQRGNSITGTVEVKTADRWGKNIGSAVLVQFDVSKETTITDKSATSCKIVFNKTSGGFVGIIQSIENPTNYASKTLTLSIRGLTTVPNSLKVGIEETGGTYSSYHSGSGNWETLTVTKTISSTPGPIYITIYMDANGGPGTYYADNAMLTIGSQPVSFAPLHPQVDLARCQRYYFRIGNPTTDEDICTSQAFTTTTSIGSIHYPVEMRVAPTITITNAVNGFQVATANGGGNLSTAMSTSLINTKVARIQATGQAASLTVGNASYLYAVVNNGKLEFSADL